MSDYRPLDANSEQVLKQAAEGVPSPNRWHAGRNLTHARNAHRTNTARELALALVDKDANFLEGDIRLGRSGRAVMAHDSSQDDGLLLSAWLKIGAASGKGLKMEVKEQAAFEPTLREAAKHKDIADRMMFNVQLDQVTPEQIEYLNERFPESMIAFSSGLGPYSEREIKLMQRMSIAIGDPERVSFPLERRGVTRDVVDALEPYGQVSVWNSVETQPFYDRGDIARDAAHFREMGAEGMIDLREGVLAVNLPDWPFGQERERVRERRVELGQERAAPDSPRPKLRPLKRSPGAPIQPGQAPKWEH